MLIAKDFLREACIFYQETCPFSCQEMLARPIMHGDIWMDSFCTINCVPRNEASRTI